MKNYFYTIFLALAAIGTLVFLSSGVNYSSGSPGGKTGSPGDGGQTCTQCHSGTASQADGLISSDIPEAGFVPGETYEVTVSVSDNEAGLFGFELTAEDDLGNKVGEFQLTDNEATRFVTKIIFELTAEDDLGNKVGEFQLTDNEATRFVNNDDAVSHSVDGTTPQDNSRTWSANWVAPEDADGNITFYTAVNVANGNGTNSGDAIFTNSVSYQISTVGIDELSVVERMYPNPASNFVHLDLTRSDLEINVYSLSGKVIESFIAEGQNTTINLEEYKTGVYFVKAGNSPMQKFLVRK